MLFKECCLGGKRNMRWKHVLFLTGMLAALLSAPVCAGEQTGSGTTRIAILSDIHYVTDQLYTEAGRQNLELIGQTEGRLMEEVEVVLSCALSSAASADPDALLVCGDLVSNGEYTGAQVLADRLNEAKQMPGLDHAGFYVVNGNHDINNSYAADCTEENITAAGRVLPANFQEMYSGLGYGEEDHYTKGAHSFFRPQKEAASQGADVENYGLLSYAADISEDITLIVLDTGIYSYADDKDTIYEGAQCTGGHVSEELLDWAKHQAKAAKEQGRLVLVMSHHGIIPHYSGDEEKVSWYMENFTIDNWQEVAATLADAGVSVCLTGHSHANDIAKYVSAQQNVLYDIETAALCMYPCSWRSVEIETKGEGKKRTYTISTDIHFMDKEIQEPEYDTGHWSCRVGEEVREFDAYYDHSLQKYSLDKTGLNEQMLKPAADYLARIGLYRVVSHEGGIKGYAAQAYDLQEGETLGERAFQMTFAALTNMEPVSKGITVLKRKCKVQIRPAKGNPDSRVAKLDISLSYGIIKEHATVTVDLSYLSVAVNQILEKLDTLLYQGDWLETPYGSSPLLKDIHTLFANVAVPAFLEPVGKKQDTSALAIMQDAWQAWHHGEEGKADTERKEKWAQDRNLLLSDTLQERISDYLWDEFENMALLKEGVKSEYPVFSSILDQPLVKPGKRSMVQVKLERGAFLSPALNSMLKISDIRTIRSLFAVRQRLELIGIDPLPKDFAAPVLERIAALQEAFTTDTNIVEDCTWNSELTA